MKKLKIIFLAFMVLLLILVVAGVIFVRSFNINSYKPQIEKVVSDALGRQFKINQDIDFAVSLVPTVVLKNVTLANPDWAKNPNMLSVDEIRVKINLMNIINRTVKIDELTVNKTAIFLEQKGKGENSWTFKGLQGQDDKDKPVERPLTAGLEEDGFSLSYDIDNVSIKDSSIIYLDNSDGKNVSYTVTIPDITLKNGKMLDIAAVFRGQELTLSGEVDNFQKILNDGGEVSFNLALKSKFGQASLVGNVKDIYSLSGIDAVVSADGTNIPYAKVFNAKATLVGDLQKLSVKDISASLGEKDTINAKIGGFIENITDLSGFNLKLNAAIPSVPNADFIKPFTVRADVKNIGNSPFKLTATFSVAAETSGISGNTDLDFTGKVPSVATKLHSDKLSVQDIINFEKLAPQDTADTNGKAAAAEEESKLFLFSQDKLPLEVMSKINVDIKADFGQIIIPNVPQKIKASVQAKLKSSVLNTDIQSNDETGTETFMLTSALDAKEPSQAMLSFDVDGKNISIGSLLSNVLGGDVEGGVLTFKITGKTKGDSLHIFASNLTGKTNILLENTKIKEKVISLGPVVVSQITKIIEANFNKQKHPEFIDIHCLATGLSFKDGQATFKDGIGMETTHLLGLISGDLNLGTERMDLSLDITSNSMLSTGITDMLTGLINVKGSFLEPSIGLSPKGVMATASTIGAALFTGGLSLLGTKVLDEFSEYKSPCSVAWGQDVNSSPIVQAKQLKAKRAAEKKANNGKVPLASSSASASVPAGAGTGTSADAAQKTGKQESFSPTKVFKNLTETIKKIGK